MVFELGLMGKARDISENRMFDYSSHKLSQITFDFEVLSICCVHLVGLIVIVCYKHYSEVFPLLNFMTLAGRCLVASRWRIKERLSRPKSGSSNA